MADNTQLSVGSGGNIIRTDDVAGIHYPTSKITLGADGTDGGFVSTANPLPISDAGGTITVDVGAGTNNIGDVDVLTVPADPFGANADAAVAAGATGSIQAKLRRLTADLDAVKTAVEIIDNVVAGSEAQVDVLTLPAGSIAATTAKTSDYDTGAGTDTVPMVGLALPASGGAVQGGTGTNPVRTDPTGTTAQPVSLNAGTNNIGDVDVLTVPADPFGANADAAATAGSTGSMQAKLRLITSQLDAIKTAVETLDNAIAGSEMQVDVLTSALPSGAATEATLASVKTAAELIDDAVVADDAAFTPATTKVVMAGYEADETATDSVDEGDGGAARMTLDRKQIVTNYAHTAGGWTPSKTISAASTNSTNVKGSAGQVGFIAAFNNNAEERFLKLYDKATAPTVGTDTPVLTLMIPGATTGAGLALSIPAGIAFASGIGFGLTTGIADADTGAVAASEIVVNLGYK